MRNTVLFRWVFYGHFWIALGATGLSWLNFNLSYRAPVATQGEYLATVFFATLGIYTLHRLLSFHKAGVRPDFRRYAIVARHARLSLVIGIASLLVSAILGIQQPPRSWWPVALALPFTVFYLLPIKRGRRLRDLPFVKVVWVAASWTFITALYPLAFASAYRLTAIAPVAINVTTLRSGAATFLYTLAVALLFDQRDTKLDRIQGVATVANKYPEANKMLAYLGLFSGVLLWFVSNTHGSQQVIAILLLLLLIFTVTLHTHAGRSEDWYAAPVNGLLLLPPLAYCLFNGIP